MHQKHAAYLKESNDKWIIHNPHSPISILNSAVWACASGLEKQCHFDGFFHCFGGLSESMGKFAGIPNKGQCVSFLTEAWLGPLLDTCSRGLCIHKRPRCVWEKNPHPLFTFKNSSGPTVFVCYAQFLFGAEAGVCEMHSRCLSSCPHSQCLLIRSDQVSHSHSCQIHFLLNQHQGFVWLWFIELLTPSWCSKTSHLVQECFLYSDSLCSYLFELFPIGSVPSRCTSCCKRPHRYLIMWRFYFSQWRNHLQDKQFKHSWTVTAVSLSD